ncbi:FecR family protein [Zobellia alginiliquefaciens]|uniref:FecR family protein n=1 Tax=Zobellia alginiliquefaciens TaxID=3032586 RepID=UPI0023E4016A|nr:FecR family protein [Zobellia alginiliquefaciens]
MKKSSLEKIIQDYLDGKIEESKLYELVQDYPLELVKKCFYDSMEVDYLLTKKYLKVDKEVAFKDFLHQIKKQTIPVKKLQNRRTYPFFKYAAIFLGVIGLGLGITTFLNSEDTHDTLTIGNEEVNLNLGDGNVKIVKGTESSDILDSEGRVIAKQTGNRISYKSTDKSGKIEYNEISVPNGKKFQLELSDGTIVHINSGSILKFPISFSVGNHRRVTLKGEAFFKVKKNEEHPFVVMTENFNVRVLGTEFNVSAYEEDSEASTVLVSGSVQLYDSLSPIKMQSKIKLIPGEKGTWNKDLKVLKRDMVDTTIYTSWIQGKLIFRDVPFKDIRKKLERRYNVTIVNTNLALDENTFSANFEEESIEEILEILDRTYEIEYEIKHNQIIIN